MNGSPYERTSTPISKSFTVEKDGQKFIINRQVQIIPEGSQYAYIAKETVNGKPSYAVKLVHNLSELSEAKYQSFLTLSADEQTLAMNLNTKFPETSAKVFAETFDFVTHNENHWKNKIKKVFRRRLP